MRQIDPGGGRGERRRTFISLLLLSSLSLVSTQTRETVRLSLAGQFYTTSFLSQLPVK